MAHLHSLNIGFEEGGFSDLPSGMSTAMSTGSSHRNAFTRVEVQPSYLRSRMESLSCRLETTYVAVVMYSRLSVSRVNPLPASSLTLQTDGMARTVVERASKVVQKPLSCTGRGGPTGTSEPSRTLRPQSPISIGRHWDGRAVCSIATIHAFAWQARVGHDPAMR